MDYYHRWPYLAMMYMVTMTNLVSSLRLMVAISNRHISAYVDHNNGTKVVEASTREFPISQYLYKTSDVSAAFNIGRVIAARCKEAGLRRVMWEHKWNRKHAKVCMCMGTQVEQEAC